MFIKLFPAQIPILWKDPEGNLDSLADCFARVAAKAPGEEALLIFPEMVSTGFTDELESLVEPPGGRWERAIQAMVDAHGVAALVGIARKQADGAITNDTLLLRPGKPAPEHVYHKIRPFRSEHKVVTPGSEVSVFAFGGAQVCPLICYDLRFPELFRTGLRKGAEIFVVMANWPSPRHAHWEILLQARAIENQAYVVGVNRCGRDPNLDYQGGTLVVDPHGEVVHHAGTGENLSEVVADLERVRHWREEFPATRDYLHRAIDGA